MGYNCDGGCRKGPCEDIDCSGYSIFNNMLGRKLKKEKREKRKKHGKRNTTSQLSSIDILMKHADKDSDGRLSMNESISYVNALMRGMKSLDMIKNDVITMDSNKDGFLIPSEIDPLGV